MSAAFVVTAAYANVAQAGLSSPTGSSDPVATTFATATTTVDGITSSVTGTVDSATTATGSTDGGVVSSTVGTATDAVSNTMEGVSNTTQGVSTTVDKTVANAETAVESIVSEPSPTGEQTVRQVASAVAPPATPPEPSAPAAAPTTAPQVTAEQPIVSGEVGTPTGQPSSEAVLIFTRVDAAPIARRGASNPTEHSRGRRFTAASAQSPTPTATFAGRQDPARPPSSLDRAARVPMPGLPSSVTTLFGGSGASGSLLVAALLGALLLAAFGRPGARLRPRPEVFRPPDVLFQLERPG